MANFKKWFVIINPTSGNGTIKQNWPKIKHLLKAYQFDYNYAFTEYPGHSSLLLQQALEKKVTDIISIGGDGTLHNIVNGIMTQNMVHSSSINVGVIPIGTGNDWVKTHGIPNNIEKAVQIMANGNIKLQDIGKIEFTGDKKTSVYFNNLAGVGFDGYVVSRVKKFKHLGAVAYALGALAGIFRFKNFQSKTTLNSEEISSETLMILIGLCNFSGGGMQLTKTPNPFDGLFDISIAQNFSKFDIIKNMASLFNGKIVSFKKVVSLKTASIQVKIDQNELPYIQADGELIGKGNFKAVIIPKSFSFYCPNASQ